jgi:hypothetical protein
MGHPMPLFERFMPGTEWQLTVPVDTHAAGTRVRIEVEPLQYAGEDELVCTVTNVETEESFVISVGVLG